MQNIVIKRALIFAFKKEGLSFIEKLKQAQKIKIGPYTAYVGEYLQQATVVLITGCGLEPSKKAISLLNSFYTELSEIYNIGFAGALSDFYDLEEVVQVGQIFTPQGELCDVEFTLHNTLPIVKCISVNAPVESLEVKININKTCDADIVDMEASAFCEVLKKFKGKVSVIKIISDYADKSFKKEILKNSKKLSDKLEKNFRLAIDN